MSAPASPQRRAMKATALLLVSGGLLAFVLLRVDLREVGAVFGGAHPGLLSGTVAFSLLSYLLLPTARWQGTLRAMGYRLPFRSLAFARLGGQPLKFAIPLKGGEAFRAIWLRRRHGVPTTHGVSSILFDMFLVAVGQLSLLCFGLALAGDSIAGALLPAIGLLGLGLLLGSKAAQRLGLRVARRVSERLHGRLEELCHGFLTLPLGTKAALTALSYVVELSEVFSMWLCCRALGVPVPLWACFVYMPIVMGITLIPVTISGLGTREVAILALFAGFGTDAQLTGAALLFTSVEFILPSLLGCAFVASFLRQIAGPAVAEQTLPAVALRPPSALWRFLGTNKRYWLLPIAVVLVLLGVLLLLTDTGADRPFVYF